MKWVSEAVVSSVSPTSFPGSSLYFKKIPWLRLATCLYACQSKQHRGWALNLILSTLSREVNVVLLCRRYFKKETSYKSEILPGQLLWLYLNLFEYEMLIERVLCLYFTAFFYITVNNLLRISLISFSHQKN